MSEENSSAIDLRVRLVREVAGNCAKSSSFAQLREDARSKLAALEKRRKEHLDLLADEFKELVKKGADVLEIAKIAKKQEDFMENCKEDARKYEAEASSFLQQAQKFRELAHVSLRSIVEDVRIGKYGRGVIRLLPQKAFRLVGIVDGFDENVDSLMHIDCDKGNIFRASAIFDISQMCELGKFPIFEVPLDVMPMTEDEKKEIRRCYDDLNLTMKYVDQESIPWDLGSIYLAEKNSVFELYTASTGDQIYFVKVRYDIYPERTVSIVGSFERINDVIIEEMKRVSWENEIALVLEKKISSGSGIVFNMIAKHLHNKYPGLILHLPQLIVVHCPSEGLF